MLQGITVLDQYMNSCLSSFTMQLEGGYKGRGRMRPTWKGRMIRTICFSFSVPRSPPLWLHCSFQSLPTAFGPRAACLSRLYCWKNKTCRTVGRHIMSQDLQDKPSIPFVVLLLCPSWRNQNYNGAHHSTYGV